MANRDDVRHQASELRRMAEAIALEKPVLSLENIHEMSAEQIEQMLHELRVHQIELEMQNEELRTAQAEIEAGRARYFDLYNLAPVGYCTLSEQGLVLEANLTASTLLGVARSTLIKQPITRFIFKEDQDNYYLHSKKQFETGEPQECELRLVKPDGTLFWAHLTATATQEEDGASVRCVAISDISERKLLEDELRQSHAMLARTERIASVGSWEWDIEADRVRWSDGLFHIFRRDPARGAPSFAEHPDIYVAEDMDRLRDAVQTCITKGAPYQLELRAIRTDGMIRQCISRGQAEYDGAGRIIRLVGSLQDITERKQAENELRKRESHIRTLMNTIPDLIWLKDADGVYLSCNKRFEQFFGASEADILGKTDYDFVDKELADIFRDFDRKAIAIGGPSSNEEQITFADDGHTTFLDTIKMPMFGADGKLIGVLGIGRDITDRKQTEAKLAESEGILRDIMESTLSGFWDWNLVANTEYLSPTLKRMFGYEDHEMENSPEAWQKIIFPEDLPCVLEVFDRHVKSRGQEPFYNEIRYRHRDGSTVWVICAGRVIEWAENGAPIRMVGCHIDITERNQAQEAVKKSNKLLQTIINTAPMRIFYKDRDLRYMGCNNAFAKDAGVASPEDVVGKDDYQLAWKEQAELYRTDDLRVLESGIPKLSYDEPQTTPEGKLIWLQTSKVPLLNDSNEIIGVLGMYEDISDRKRAEEALREQRDFSESLIETAQAIILVLDTKGRIVRFNPYMEKLVGYDLDEVKGMDWFETFLTQEIDRTIKPLFQKAVDDIQTSGNVNPIIAKDGRAILVEWYNKTLKDKDGCTVGILAIGQDITEREQAEETLRESQQFNMQIIQSAKEGIIVYGPDLRYQAWNPFMEQMTGIPASEVLGKYPLEVFPFLQETGVIERLEKVLAGERVNSIEFPFCLQSTGKSGWTRDNSAPFHNDKGEIVGVIGIVSDITESKCLEEEQKMLQSQLQQAQKMEAIGTLAGGIAHDFNNILGAILGYAEMAQEDSSAGSILRQDIDQIVKASHRARELVKQILAFSRQAETERMPLQPALIIQEAIRMLRSSLPSTIDIKQNIDMDAGLIQASPTQIHQVVMNLGTNAFHAMEEKGGTLVISLEKKTLNERDIVDKPGVQPGDFVQLSVGDTGPGIAPELWDKIFDPYFTTKEVGKGTGMGLAIIHGIVKSYGGWVSFQSRPGQGTVFQVLLPVMAEEAVVANKPEETVQFGNERILFIDDEELLAEMGRSMLERLGYQVTVLSSSLEALRIFQSRPDTLDLVITDQTMPEMTGVDMARRMLQIRPGMPIILCTGYSSLISKDKAKSLGIKGFAMKPLAKKDIAKLIREVLDGGRLPG